MTSTCLSETKPRTSRRGRKILLRSVVLCVTAVLLWASAGFFLFVAPATNEPRYADVLFVLGPPDERISYAEELMDHGYAGTLAISVTPDDDGNPDPPLCNTLRAYRVVCFVPDPYTTQGEARSLQSISNEYGWETANVLTVQSHVTRSRVIIERCYKGGLSMVAYWQNLPLLSFKHPSRSWVYRYAYETAAFVKVALDQEC